MDDIKTINTSTSDFLSMMYDNMKNEINTDEKMEYIQMKGVTRSD